MSALVWDTWAPDWLLYDKVSFNGISKIIYVHTEVTTFDIRRDLYTSWIDWSAIDQNSKYLPAIRYTGLDQIGSGVFTGDTYFLINGWKLSVNLQNVRVTGVLFSDDYISAYYTENMIIQYPVSVAAIVNTVSTGGGSGGATPAEIWAYNNRTLTTAVPPTLAQIEASSILAKQATIISSTATISAQIDTISTQHITILDAIENITISSSAINAPPIAFTKVSGTVISGTFADTRSINTSSHIITDAALAFDINYTFDIGLSSIPSEIHFVGRVADKHETVNVGAWNYITNAWESIGIIAGSLVNISTSFVMYSQFVGTTAGLIGDVKIRFYSTALSDIILSVDQLYVSYAVLERPMGYSGHAVTATNTTIQLGLDASSLDNYYAPALIYVNHGTGAMQYAKVISYTGLTKTLTLELPMVVALDSTSHITMSPWANTAVDSAAIATAVRLELTPELSHSLTLENNPGLTNNQATMLLELFNLAGLDPTKPLIVSKSGTYTGTRVAGTINQNISGDSTQTIVTRV